MQIGRNQTPFLSEITTFTDPAGRGWAVVVVKGTFEVRARGRVDVAETQQPFVFSDEHQGDPATSSLRYESDFAPFKPLCDVIVNGEAMGTGGQRTRELEVGISLGTLRKSIRVLGERRWTRSALGLRASSPAPFNSMPLVYEKSYGGVDVSHPDPAYHGASLENPVGVGFTKNPNSSHTLGSLLPSLEHPNKPTRAWNEEGHVIGLGSLGRGWQPRIAWAGTYDQAWKDNTSPFLPEDFDYRYFQSAPLDQQLSTLDGQPTFECKNMCSEGQWGFQVPSYNLSASFNFMAETRAEPLRLDTLIVEPSASRFILTWRARSPLGRKASALEGVDIQGGP